MKKHHLYAMIVSITISITFISCNTNKHMGSAVIIVDANNRIVAPQIDGVNETNNRFNNQNKNK